MSNAKVYVIHENIEWTQHLVKWLEKIQVPYELWDLSSGILYSIVFKKQPCPLSADSGL